MKWETRDTLAVTGMISWALGSCIYNALKARKISREIEKKIEELNNERSFKIYDLRAE